MTHHEDLLERLEQANPVPEPSRLNPEESRRFSHLVEQRRERIDDTKKRPIKPGEKPSSSNRRTLIAAAAFALVGVGIGTTLLTGLLTGEGVGDDAAGVPTPTTTDQQAFAVSIAEAGLPTEWKIGFSTQSTDVPEGVRLDTSFQLRSEQFFAEGTMSVVEERVQGVVVECLGETYDEEFFWVAMSRGTGELDFGDSGSVTIEFDAVSVAATETASPRVCHELSGTYTGASGDLADALGTFNATLGQSGGATLTFDS